MSKPNAQAERAVRSVLEGTRVNLLQTTGIGLMLDIGASCRMYLQRGAASPGSKFEGPLVPFGCLVDCWNGPRKKNKDGLRFDPTSSPGLFLGYAIHPEFMWRKEFMVVPTKGLIENEANGTAYRQSTTPVGCRGRTSRSFWRTATSSGRGRCAWPLSHRSCLR